MYQHILVPVDGSDTALLGLHEAIKIAKSVGGQIRLVHIVNEFVFDYAFSPGLYADGIIEELRAGGKKILEGLAATARQQGIQTDCVMLESIGGVAADLIVAQAGQWPADLIVMGTHGRRGIRRLALGSDAEEVVRAAAVPVLLVRGGGATVAAGARAQSAA